MTKPGASSSPPGIGFGAGETRLDDGEGAAILGDGRVSPATVAPVTVPAAVRTNRRLPKTLPIEVPVMRPLSLVQSVRAFRGRILRCTDQVNAVPKAGSPVNFLLLFPSQRDFALISARFRKPAPSKPSPTSKIRM